MHRVVLCLSVLAMVGCGEEGGGIYVNPHLGPSMLADAPPEATSPTPPRLTSCISQIAAGSGHTCAVLQDGAAWCWGSNAYLQLGTSGVTSSAVPLKVQFPASPVPQVGPTPVITQMALGAAHTCALRSDGVVVCFGDNQFGQLGDTDPSARANPVAVALSAPATQLAAGAYHTCARLGDGSLWCWGRDQENQLGDFAGVNSPKPTEFTAIGHHVAEVAAGAMFTCARTTGGAVMCFGDNQFGSMGNGTFVTKTELTWVRLPRAAAHIYAGATHACALSSDGMLFCWGGNAAGQLGNGTTENSSVPVAACTTVKTANLGPFDTCAVMADSRLLCWGAGAQGQLGDGALLDRSVPAAADGNGYSGVASGLLHTCASRFDGVWCWGYGGDGRLGTTDFADTTVGTPVRTMLTCNGSSL